MNKHGNRNLKNWEQKYCNASVNIYPSVSLIRLFFSPNPSFIYICSGLLLAQTLHAVDVPEFPISRAPGQISFYLRPMKGVASKEKGLNKILKTTLLVL